jgi:hypothetical protein
MALMPPILTAADPTEESEGNIDPFTTQAGYERLAEKIYPYCTVRMLRPRYLTPITVGALVCQPFREEFAADGLTPSYLVFEWYVMEAFVCRRTQFTEDEWIRFPGSRKVERAVRDGRRVSADLYLKTPKVFGYTGIHKRLAIGLELVTDDLDLDEGGYELLRLWEREQGLDGFLSGRSGPGAVFREDLRSAVRRGLEVARTAEWHGKAIRDRVTDHLRPDKPGAEESRWIFNRLMKTDYSNKGRDPVAASMRRELIERIVDQRRPVQREDERAFFQAAAKSCSEPLRERLEVIDTYEGLCRPLDDALRLILHLSTRAGSTPVGAPEFAAHDLARQLVDRLSRGISRAKANRALLDWEPEVQAVITRYETVASPRHLFDLVTYHHEESQRHKPPDGKRPWFVRTTGDRVEVRPQYTQEEPPPGDDSYVYIYRTPTMSRLLQDLGRLPV